MILISCQITWKGERWTKYRVRFFKPLKMSKIPKGFLISISQEGNKCDTTWSFIILFIGENHTNDILVSAFCVLSLNKNGISCHFHWGKSLEIGSKCMNSLPKSFCYMHFSWAINLFAISHKRMAQLNLTVINFHQQKMSNKQRARFKCDIK